MRSSIRVQECQGEGVSKKMVDIILMTSGMTYLDEIVSSVDSSSNSLHDPWRVQNELDYRRQRKL